MTPGARVAAAIEVLDQIRAGVAAEPALTAWGRTHRFAGSKDRAAIRDHVFDVLRARRSLSDGSGRDLMIRLLVRDGWDVDAYFDGVGHAPAPLDDDERAALGEPLVLTDAAASDIPDWLWPQWCESLGKIAGPAAQAGQARADVFLRVNLRRTTRQAAADALLAQDIDTQPHPTVQTCLRVTRNPRRVKTSDAFTQGLVELQDASSQFAISAVSVPTGGRILDYCAGGGGKALALADQQDALVFAHDIAPRRMADLPARAGRAQVQIATLSSKDVTAQAPYDLVFCDAPCSGSGTWRRTPDAKWQLTQDRLVDLQEMQDDVLAKAAPLVARGGVLAYATCSVLACENDQRIARFRAANPKWDIVARHHLVPGPDGDGFYLCLMECVKNNL